MERIHIITVYKEKTGPSAEVLETIRLTNKSEDYFNGCMDTLKKIYDESQLQVNTQGEPIDYKKSLSEPIKMLKNMKGWSDRLGSDEIAEINQVINVLLE